ncbi:hypothetical protein D9M68_765970 [compost metagenome]
MMEMLAVQRCLAIGTARHQLAVRLVGRIGDLDEHRHAARWRRFAEADQRSRRLHLPFADHPDDIAHLAGEDLAGNTIEGYFGLIAD